MLSFETRNKLADTLLAIGDGERQIEIVRQILCEQRDFEPYAAFKRIDRYQKGTLDASDILNFLADNRVFYTEENCQVFINRYDVDRDGQLVYEEFLYAVLPMDNPTLRTVTTQRPNYNVSNYQLLSYDVEYSLAKVLDREIAFYLNVDYHKATLHNSYDYNNIDAFAAIDRFNTGFIDYNNLREFFRRMGIYPNEDDLIAILRRIDRNEDGRLGLEEFSVGLEPVDNVVRTNLTKPRITAFSPSRYSKPKPVSSPLRKQLSPVRKPVSPNRSTFAYRTASPLRRTFSPNSSRASHFSRTDTFSRKVASPSRRIASPGRPLRRVATPGRRIASPIRREASPRRTSSPFRREASPTRRVASPTRRVVSPIRREASPIRRIASPIRREASPYRRLPSPRREASPTRRFPSPRRTPLSPRRIPSPRRVDSPRRIHSPLRETRNFRPVETRRLVTSPAHRATTASPAKVEKRRSPLRTTLNTRGAYTVENRLKAENREEVPNVTSSFSNNSFQQSLANVGSIRHSSPLRQTLTRSLIPKSPTQIETLNRILGKSELSNSRLQKSSEKLAGSIKKVTDFNAGTQSARSGGQSGKKSERKVHNEANDVLVDVLKQFIQLEKELEGGKQDLALRPDFNLLDFFRTFDIEGRGSITSNEFAEGMKKYGVYANKEELFLLMRRLDRDNDGKLKFSDFNEAFSCKQQEYASLLSNRTPVNADLSLNVDQALTEETKRAVGRILRLHLNNEGATEGLRQRLGRKSNFNAHEAFSYLDTDGDGYVTSDELRQILDKHDYYATQREVRLLLDRLDGNRDGKISYSEFVNEIVPKSEKIF